MRNLYKLLASVVVCELVGLAGTPFTVNAIPTWYASLEKPFFSPPNWLFGPVWTVLYLLMGISFYLVWKQGFKNKREIKARNFFLAQLGLNFLWTPVFFGLKSPFLGLIVIVSLWVMILKTIQEFYPLSKWSAYLLLPYLLWVSFASLLNGAIFILN